MLERITASLSSLAPAEQRVGKLVLLDPRSFASLPVTELAARAHVSKPTVVRFCRSMGYDGLSDFKLKLAGTVSEGVPFIHRSVDLDDKVNDVLVKVIDNNVAAFLNTVTTRPAPPLRRPRAPCSTRAYWENALNFLVRVTQASWHKTHSTSFFAWVFQRWLIATDTCKS